MRNIQVFLSFANFDGRFIEGFSKITGLLTLMLRTSSTTQSAENLPSDMAEDVEVGIGGNCSETVKRSLSTSKNSSGATGYQNSDIRKTFT